LNVAEEPSAAWAPNDERNQLLHFSLDFSASLTLLRRRPDNVRLARLPRDAALVIACDDGGPLMPSHGLHDGSDDFSVVVPRLVAPALLPELEEVKL
jgi:hypothetical protein